MKPLIILLIAFTLSLGTTKIATGTYNIAFSGRAAMSAMLVFSAIGHFAFSKGMSMMIPPFLPFKVQAVYLSGLLEILLAIGLLLTDYKVLSAWLIIAFLLLTLPINVHAALKHVDYQKGDYHGNGPAYLWFRIPLQVFFLAWTWFSAIYIPRLS